MWNKFCQEAEGKDVSTTAPGLSFKAPKLVRNLLNEAGLQFDYEQVKGGRTTKKVVQVFQEDALWFDINTHRMQPRREVLNAVLNFSEQPYAR